MVNAPFDSQKPSMSDRAVTLIVLAACRGKLPSLRPFIPERLGGSHDGLRGNGTGLLGSGPSASYLIWPETFKMRKPRATRLSTEISLKSMIRNCNVQCRLCPGGLSSVAGHTNPSVAHGRC